MKIRSGFVSNSSSSSFVLLGYRMKREEFNKFIGNPDDYWKKINELDLSVVDLENNDVAIGLFIADIDDDYGIEETEFNFKELENMIVDINKKLKIEHKEPSLFTGVRPT